MTLYRSLHGRASSTIPRVHQAIFVAEKVSELQPRIHDGAGDQAVLVSGSAADGRDAKLFGMWWAVFELG